MTLHYMHTCVCKKWLALAIFLLLLVQTGCHPEDVRSARIDGDCSQRAVWVINRDEIGVNGPNPPIAEFYYDCERAMGLAVIDRFLGPDNQSRPELGIEELDRPPLYAFCPIGVSRRGDAIVLHLAPEQSEYVLRLRHDYLVSMYHGIRYTYQACHEHEPCWSRWAGVEHALDRPQARSGCYPQDG